MAETLRFETPDGPLDTQITEVIVAGWTGRDAAAVRHHIDELAALGVAPPSEVPLYYRVSRGLLTQASEIEVLGQSTSGEVEPVILRVNGRLWLGLGSDHTDRDLEAVSVAASKQACPKPVARTVWPLDTVEDPDSLCLVCEIEERDTWVSYQKGSLAAIRPLTELLSASALPEGGALFCGTLSAIDGVRPSKRYRMRIENPQTGAEIALEYAVSCLPIVA